MPWPGLNDLQEALQHPERAFTDREIRDGKIALNRLGLPRSWSGNFAAVFQVVTNGHPYAIRCFTHNPLGKQHHYAAIDRHLKTKGRPATFIDFDYQETGLVCRGQKYPLIKMPWINGQTLDEFTYENISRADVLEQLVSKWYQAATELQQLPIAHNDLQHGNIMVVKGSRSDIKLVDYDGLYVPQFAQMQSPENGHRHYQHPQRDQRHYGPQVDNFPALVIYTSLTALAHDSGARARRATPESLLFAQDDLQDPTNSKLFQYLKQSPHRPTSQLANVLSEAALAPVDDTPTLEQARAQPPKGSLPSWLNQPTPPSAPAWIKAVTPVQPTSTNTFRPPTTAPVAAPDPAQHNRHLFGQTLQPLPRFKNIAYEAETFIAVIIAAISIIAVLAFLAAFLLTDPPPSETTKPPASQAEPPRATPRPPIQSPGSGDSVLPTITLAPLITNPLGGIPALGKHYEECNGKYEHILNQNARKQDFANKIKSGITLRQLQQFVTDECPLPATFNLNVPSNPQPNTHTAPPPVATDTLTKTPTPTKTPGPTFSPINPEITIDQGNDQTSKEQTGNERQEAFQFTGQALDNTEINLSDTIGTPTLLVFWSHW